MAGHAAVVIGGGRVGTAISLMHHPPAPVLRRSQQIPSGSGPLYVAVANDSLDAVLAATPPTRQADLVFIQNGMLLPWLRRHGLERSATQVLLYMAAAPDGSVTDGKLTVVHGGRWAAAAAELLRSGGVTARVEGDPRAFYDAMATKLLWATIFWMLSAALGSATVGEIVSNHTEAVEALVAELLPIVDSYLAALTASADAQSPAAEGVAGLPNTQQQQQQQQQHPEAEHQQGDPGRQQQRCAEVTEALLAYSRAIAGARPSKDMALQEWRWRNGWFLEQGRTPQHVDWLRRAGVAEDGSRLTGEGDS